MTETQYLDDDRVMSLVELALARPPEERKDYLTSACAGDTALFEKVWNYVQAEHRMQRFLLDPLCAPASHEDPFQPEELVEGRFRIVREVARGGMGVVYEARDEKLDRRIAIKCARRGFRQWLPPEVRNASEISHPNVCRIFEIHTASTPGGEIDFITMEFLDGVTLDQRLHSGPVPREEAFAIARQLSAGLAEAHRNGVVHGDLKSNNVILSSSADGAVRAVITDFGLARRPGTAQTSGQSARAAGTPDYMAPELWKGQKTSVASDIYALGMILYELASGERPHPPTTPWRERFEWRPGPVDPKWDPILARCLDPDPAGRFREAGEIAQALAPPRSRAWILIAAAAAVLLATVSGIVAYKRASPPRETVRLAMLPFVSGKATEAMVDGLSRETAVRLAALTGNARTRLTFIPPREVARRDVNKVEKAAAALGATQVLHGSLAMEDGKVILEAYLTDPKSLLNARVWRASYALGELRYAPLALAGMVTETLHLPPPVNGATVNAAARPDYVAGLSDLSRDSTVERALPLLERAVFSDPDSPLTYAALAQGEWFRYFFTRDRQWRARTEESLRQAQIRNPDVAQAHRVAGLLNADAGRYEQAQREYIRATELEPANGDAYRWLAAAYEDSSQLDEALRTFRKAIEVDPENYRNYQNLGSYYVDRSQYNDAAVQFAKAVHLAPGESGPHFALGSAWMDLGRFSDAETEFRSAIRVGETPTALHTLGVTLMYEGRDREAITYIERALQIGPERYRWWTNLGIAYRRIGLNTESVRASLRGLEIAEQEVEKNPRDGDARSFLAYLCARIGDGRRAASEIAQAVSLSPADENVRFMAVLTYEALGLRKETLAVLSGTPHEVIADLGRYPDLADLHQDPRFIELSVSAGGK
jgi:Flp pilus assembly protein TadD/tRNA A-37 threonylcarbamoyl transferase component Bud32